MARPFPYPVPTDALALCCHPREGHALAKPVEYNRETWAGNGYLVIRVSRGRWLEGDFPADPDAAMARMGRLPWVLPVELPPTGWRAGTEIRTRLKHYDDVAMWTPEGRIAPCQVWQIGETLVRLSILQLVCRLPQVEIHLTAGGLTGPLYFQFSGGFGQVARDESLRGRTPAIRLFQPAICPMDGQRVVQRSGAVGNLPLPNWPPPEPID